MLRWLWTTALFKRIVLLLVSTKHEHEGGDLTSCSLLKCLDMATVKYGVKNNNAFCTVWHVYERPVDEQQ